MPGLTIIKKTLSIDKAIAGNIPAKPDLWRIYSDEEVGLLPEIPASHLYYKDWVMAKHYSRKLLEHIQQRNNEANILVTGCRNGWLAAYLSEHTKSLVVGIDNDNGLIEQARRVFASNQLLQFECADIESVFLHQKKFDIIVLAGHRQSNINIPAFLNRALKQASLYGEIHIILPGTHQAQMFKGLSPFQYKVLHRPAYFFCGYSFIKNPFYHIVVKNHYI